MKRFSGLELKSLSVNTVTQFIVRLIGSLSTLITTLLIATFLGLDAVGSFTKVVAFVSAFYLLIDFGFNSMLLRYFFKEPEKYIGNVMIIRLAMAIVLVPVIGVLAALLPHNALSQTGFSPAEKGAITIYSLTLIGIAINNSLQAFLQGKLIYKISVLPSLLAGAALVGIVLYATYINNFNLLFTAYIFYWIIFSTLTFLFLKYNYGLALHIHKLLPFSKKMLIYSWPLGAMLFFSFLYSRADILILSYFKPSTDVGIYGISYRFFDVAVALPTFLANSTYPLLLKHIEKAETYKMYFKKYFRLYIILSIVALFLLGTFAPLIGILNQEFSKSILPLQLLSLSLPFFFLTSLLQWHFLIRKKIMFLVPLYGGIFIVNVMLNIFFVPLYSYYASAVITGACEALVFAIMVWYFNKTN